MCLRKRRWFPKNVNGHCCNQLRTTKKKKTTYVPTSPTSSVWSSISETSKCKQPTLQNSSLCLASGCTSNTHTHAQHQHTKTNTLHLQDQIRSHASQLWVRATYGSSTARPSGRANSGEIIDGIPWIAFWWQRVWRHERNILKPVSRYLTNCELNVILNTRAPEISTRELDREKRRRLAQLRSGKSPRLLPYKNKNISGYSIARPPSVWHRETWCEAIV